MAKLVEYIYTLEHIGTGTTADPHRQCPQLWTKEGVLVAQYDPCNRERTWFDPCSEFPPRWSFPPDEEASR